MDYTKDDEIKKSIVEAAKRTFQKWGLNKTTMEDIAKEAGKGKSTLYYYFKSKDELFDIVASNEFFQVLSEAKIAIEGIVSAKEKLRTYIVVMLTTLREHLILYTLVRVEIKGNRSIIDKVKKKIVSEEEALIKEILIGGVKTNEFSFVDENELNKAAVVIAGIIDAMEFYLFLDNDDIDQIDVAAKLIANGI